MDTALTVDRQGKAASTLIGRAVHRSRAITVDGALERLFGLAFKGLVYPQIWEDPDVDMKAMAIEPHHHVVAISSGGCNVLSYLTANPARITAVDLSPAHVALVKLKIVGFLNFPNWQTFYRFFGEANSSENMMEYREHLRDDLEPGVRAYWEGRQLNGRKRISSFRKNIYRKGLLGRFIGASHWLARLGGGQLRNITLCESIEEQRAFFIREMAPLFDKPLIRFLTSYRASLFGLGIPPAQYQSLSNGKHMADVLRNRLEKLACGFPLAENYFAWQAFNRGYAPGASGPLPPYLLKEHFETLRKRVERVQMLHASLTDTIAAMPAASVHRFVLLDAQDWMNDTQLNALWRSISHAAAPGARVIFRTAGSVSVLPGRVASNELERWSYLAGLSSDLHAQDRSAIYGGFHVYERCR